MLEIVGDVLSTLIVTPIKYLLSRFFLKREIKKEVLSEQAYEVAEEKKEDAKISSDKYVDHPFSRMRKHK